MNYDFNVNEKIPIGRLGKWFRISGKNNIDGIIEFTDDLKNCHSEGLRKNNARDFNIEDMRKDGRLTFDPYFVEFIGDKSIDAISIIITPINPQAK